MRSRRLDALAWLVNGLVIGGVFVGTPLDVAATDVEAPVPVTVSWASVAGTSKHAETVADTPATVTVVTRDDLERYGFRTLADVLTYASLGDFILNDRRYDFVGSRGLFVFEDFNTRMLVLLDGHPLNEPWNNFVGLGREMLLPLDLVERVEIVYGPASILYGGYSLYGVVNVVTRSAAALSGGRLRLSAGEWKTWEGVASWGLTRAVKGSETPLEVVVAGGLYQSDGENLDLPRFDAGYPTNFEGGTEWGGPQHGTDFERAPFAFLRAGWGDFTLLARTGSRKHGQPMAPYEAVYGDRGSTVRDEKSFGELRWERLLTGRLGLSVRLFRDEYAFEEREVYADAETYPPDPGYSFVLEADDTDDGGEARLAWLGTKHFLTLGGEFRRRRIHQGTFDELLDGSVAPDTASTDRVRGHLAVVYLQEEWQAADKLKLILGGTWADTDPGGTTALPRVAAVFRPRSNLSIKAMWGRGFRPPSVYEATYADEVSQIGNPTLKSEEITTSEISLRWSVGPRLALQACAFDSKQKGLIQGIEIESPEDIQGGIVPPSGDPTDLIGFLQYQATGDVRSRGAGIGIRTVSGAFHAFGNLAWARARLEARDGTEQDKLPGDPSWLANFGVSVDVSKAVVASLSGRWVSEQMLDPAHGEGETGSLAQANLRLGWKGKWGIPLAVWLDVWNLFDEEGPVPASSIYAPATIPLEGRKAVLSTELRF